MSILLQVYENLIKTVKNSIRKKVWQDQRSKLKQDPEVLQRIVENGCTDTDTDTDRDI